VRISGQLPRIQGQHAAQMIAGPEIGQPHHQLRHLSFYSQWFSENKSNIADCCSCHFDFPNSSFLSHLKSNFANQLPTVLDFRPLPEPILSWVTCVIQKVHGIEPLPPPPPKTSNKPGAIGINSSNTLNSRMTISCLCSRRNTYTRLAEGTFKATINHVALIFQDFSQRDPKKNGETGQTLSILSQQYRGYRNEDPKVKPLKAIPVCVPHEVGRCNCVSIKDVALGQLGFSAFYFTMRCCEYLKATVKVENC
jgi:hypothetical protein